MRAVTVGVSLLLASQQVNGATPTRGHVQHGVHRQLQRGGTADIVVTMRTPPPRESEVFDTTSDASRGGQIKAMVDRLESHAASSQRSIDQLLAHEASGNASLFDQQYRSLVLNARFFQGATLPWVEALAALPDVAEIREQETIDVYDMPSSARRLDLGSASPSVIQWGIARIHAPEVWAMGINGSGVVVGSIDSGVRGSHELLRTNHRSDYGWFSPAERSAEPNDRKGHGTHTMGTMVGAGGVGVAPGAQWIACQACLTSCTEAAIVQCTEWMLCPTDASGQNKDCSKAPHVINNSWSTRSGTTTHQPIIDAWVAAGIVPVFSNGNQGPTCGTVGSPGEYENVVSVGNVAEDGSLAPSSSRGPSASGIIKPDLSAPGQLIASASYLDDAGLRVVSGTSMAAPHVAGAVALLLSAKPGLSVAALRELLTSSADRTSVAALDTTCSAAGAWPNNDYGHGILNVHAAYQKLSVPSTIAPPAPIAGCALEYDVDIVGSDMGNTAGPNAQSCCAMCLERAGCRAFTWSSYEGGTCWFKDRSTSARVTNVGAVSATVDRDSGAQCRVSAATDFAGNDLVSITASSSGTCCSLCAERRSQGCRAYSWSNYQGGTCWLKTARGSATGSPGVVSGEYGA